jgi:hypothetical protein
MTLGEVVKPPWRPEPEIAWMSFEVPEQAYRRVEASDCDNRAAAAAATYRRFDG